MKAGVRIQVLFFAVLRERIGRESETLELPARSRVSDALDQVSSRFPALPPLRGRIQTALNRRMAPLDEPLSDGDELALIPPVSGGSAPLPPRRILVSPEKLSLDEATAAITGPEHGGLVTFTGQVRRHGQLREVERLEYEAYVPMAEEVLRGIADELELEFPGARVAIHHRIGTLHVGEAAVVIAVAGAHRAEAFAACRVAIERLKQRAPIWKKEVGPDGAVWVGQGP